MFGSNSEVCSSFLISAPFVPPLGGGGAPPVVTDKKKKSAVSDGALRLITAVSLLHQVKAMPCEGAAVVRRMPLTRGFVGEVDWLPFFVTLAIVLATSVGVCCLRCGWLLAAPKKKVVEQRTVATQSQTTYRRKLATPRFQPLLEDDHGVWEMTRT